MILALIRVGLVMNLVVGSAVLPRRVVGRMEIQIPERTIQVLPITVSLALPLEGTTLMILPKNRLLLPPSIVRERIRFS
jgi:hypothetical protein